MRLRLAPVGALCLTMWVAGRVQAQDGGGPKAEVLHYSAGWRFVRAGEVSLAVSGKESAELKLRTTGLVATFIKVDDLYRAVYGPGWCAAAAEMTAREGRRQRETKITFDRERRKANYVERDLARNTTVAAHEISIPACVHDILGGLARLRELRPAPGSTVELPVSDGKKAVMARVEAQGRDTVRTPVGEFSALRYEAFLMSGVMYRRKGRLLLWLSDDGRRLPVQIRIQFPFYIGTVTLQLERVE